MKHILLLTICCLLAVATYAGAPTRMNISQAIQQNIITVTAVATGSSYTQQGLRLTIKNNGSLNFIVIMNHGVIFKPETEGYQPLILAGEENLLLAPLKEAQVNVQTFCADSRQSAPIKGLAYTFSKTSGDTLVKVLGYIKQNRLYNSLGQSAVWHFTNGHELNTVYDAGNEYASKKLQDFIVNLTGQKRPEYFTQPAISATPGQAVYNPKTLKIYASFDEKFDAPKTLTLGVFNQQGEMIQPVFENRIHGAAGHRFRVEFSAKDVPAGKYYIRLKESDTILRETMVEVK